MKKSTQVIHVSLSERDDPDAQELAQGLKKFKELHQIPTDARAIRALLKLGLENQDSPKASRILAIAKMEGGRKNWHKLGQI